MNNSISAPVRGALFDLDGVLIDTEPLYTEFWRQVGLKHQLPSPTFAYDIKGTTLKDILSRYFPDKAIQDDIVRMVHDFEDNIVYPVFDGVVEFLDRLQAAGWKIAIVTSSDDQKMEYLFNQIPWMKSRFDTIINGTMVRKSKPDPEGYLKAAQLLGCKPEDCVVFEDSLQGLEAGRRSGAKVVALATTNSRENLAGKSDLIIDNFKELNPEML
ncbi:MAG: HAD family phosphatase [Muribaculaceae bacterium]|nr:HAD family phosphatase [Muribaculaceae bacterium]MDE7092227.1 HAD family phosphatase [Muribaculaceae bacterium]